MWYTIESQDDWLSKIALRYLGDAQKWTLIYDQNKDIVGSDPNKIQIGMRIWVPINGEARPASSNTSTQTGATTSSPSSGGGNTILYVGLATALLGASFLMLKK